MSIALYEDYDDTCVFEVDLELLTQGLDKANK